MEKSQVTRRKSRDAGRTVMVCALSLVWGVCLGGVAAGQPGFPGGYGGSPTPGRVSTEVPPQLKEATFKQRLNERLPLDATFRDETGREVKLGQYFTGEKPVLLAFVYYSCPMLCTQVMNGLSSALRV